MTLEGFARLPPHARTSAFPGSAESEKRNSWRLVIPTKRD